MIYSDLVWHFYHTLSKGITFSRTQYMYLSCTVCEIIGDMSKTQSPVFIAPETPNWNEVPTTYHTVVGTSFQYAYGCIEIYSNQIY